MAGFEPTAAERQKYSDYDVEIRDAKNNRVAVRVDNGEVIRFYARAHRIPSLKKFVVFVYIGATDEDRQRAERWAATLPAGGWAQFPHAWFKKRSTSGTWFWKQEWGHIAPDPFLQLELELLIDAGSEVSA
jgi:ABC-type amino acid transport substrate-binding protein